MSRWKHLWHLLNLSCRDASRLASESLDRDLGRMERLALKSHLFICVACRRYLRQLLLLRQALQHAAPRLAAGPSLVGARLPDDVRARIKQALRES
jgi:hypothetical protein